MISFTISLVVLIAGFFIMKNHRTNFRDRKKQADTGYRPTGQRRLCSDEALEDLSSFNF
jgi:hypothetical protein